MRTRSLVGGLTVAAALLGWLGIVWGLALAIGRFVWPIGLGLLLLALVGYRLLWAVLRDGIYGLLFGDEAMPGPTSPAPPGSSPTAGRP